MGPDNDECPHCGRSPGDVTKEALCRWRGVDDPCIKCHGTGTRVYSSTATWRGGVGGCMMTTDVCDACWGTGDRFRTGTDLRRLRDEMDAQVAKRAVTLLAESVGASYSTARVQVDEICQALEKLANKRGVHYMTATLAEGLVKQLKKGIRG